MTKTFGYSKRYGFFDQCLHSTHIWFFVQFDVQLLFMFVNKYLMLNASNIYPSVKIILPFYVTHEKEKNGHAIVIIHKLTYTHM